MEKRRKKNKSLLTKNLKKNYKKNEDLLFKFWLAKNLSITSIIVIVAKQISSKQKFAIVIFVQKSSISFSKILITIIEQISFKQKLVIIISTKFLKSFSKFVAIARENRFAFKTFDKIERSQEKENTKKNTICIERKFDLFLKQNK